MPILPTILLAALSSSRPEPAAAAPSLRIDLVPVQGGFCRADLAGWRGGPLEIGWSGDVEPWSGNGAALRMLPGRTDGDLRRTVVSDPRRLREIASEGLWLRIPVSDSLRHGGSYRIGARRPAGGAKDTAWLRRGLSRRLPLRVREPGEDMLEVSAPAGSGERWGWEGIDTSGIRRSDRGPGIESIQLPTNLFGGEETRLVLRRSGRRALVVPVSTVIRTSLSASDCPDASPTGGFRGPGHAFGPDILCERERDSIAAIEDRIHQEEFARIEGRDGPDGKALRRLDSLRRLLHANLTVQDTAMRPAHELEGNSLGVAVDRGMGESNPFSFDPRRTGRLVVESRQRRPGARATVAFDTALPPPRPGFDTETPWSGRVRGLCEEPWSPGDSGWEIRARIVLPDTAGEWNSIRFSCRRPHPALSIARDGLEWTLRAGSVDSARSTATGDWEIGGLPLLDRYIFTRTGIRLAVHGATSRATREGGSGLRWGPPTGGWLSARWCEDEDEGFSEASGFRYCEDLDTVEASLGPLDVLLPLRRSSADSEGLATDSALVRSSAPETGIPMHDSPDAWTQLPVPLRGRVRVGPAGPVLPLATREDFTLSLSGEGGNRTRILVRGKLEIRAADGGARLRIDGDPGATGPRVKASLWNSPIEDMSGLEATGTSTKPLVLATPPRPKEGGVPLLADPLEPISVVVDTAAPQPLREGWSIRVHRFSVDTARIVLDSFDIAPDPALVDTSRAWGWFRGLGASVWEGDPLPDRPRGGDRREPIRLRTLRGWILEGSSVRMVAGATSPTAIGMIHGMEMVTPSGEDVYVEIGSPARIVAPRATLLDDADLGSAAEGIALEATRLQWGPPVRGLPDLIPGKLLVEASRRDYRESRGKLRLSGHLRLSDDGAFSLDSARISLDTGWIRSQPDLDFRRTFLEWGDRLRLCALSGFLPLDSAARIPLDDGRSLSGSGLELELGPGPRLRVRDARLLGPSGARPETVLREAVLSLDGRPLLLQPR